MPRQLSQEEIDDLKASFDMFDKDGSGKYLFTDVRNTTVCDFNLRGWLLNFFYDFNLVFFPLNTFSSFISDYIRKDENPYRVSFDPYPS